MSETGEQILTVECANCGTPLHLQNGVMMRCPRCPAVQMAEGFPAFWRKPDAGRHAEALVIEGEASCFYHAQKKAVVACEECGRFLCGLCEVEFGGRRLCPACIEAGKTKNKIKTLEERRVLYDDLALTLAILPILAWPVTLVTAPAALYYAIRYWKTPTSILPRTRVRFILAATLALLQMTGWGFLIYTIVTNLHSHASR